MNRQHVIIIGAGAAGLIAALELSEKCDVTVIESQKKTGGRIRTIPLNNENGVVEAGAEFIHGDLPITSRLLKEASLKSVKVEGKMLRKERNKWIEQEDMIEGWDELLEKMKGQKKDMTIHDFMMKYFPGEKYSDLRRHIRLFVEGFDVADPKEVSVQSLYKEWSNEGDQFRILSGYGSMISFLENKCRENECRIVTGETVKQIDWQKNEVTVYTASGIKYEAQKVIITIPVSVLRNITGKASINMTPPVDEYINALRQIGFGTVIKVVFKLSEKIWKKDTGFVFSDEMIPTWWTQFPIDNNLLTGWAGGPVAERLSHHTDDELLEIAVTCVARIFDKPVSEIRKIIIQSFVFNWIRYEETLGAYSFSTPDSSSARQLLNKPLADTVFFAGEGLYDGEYGGTVEAAFDSGTKTASKLLKVLS